MNIQQLTRVMQQRNAQRIIITTDEPLLVLISDKWHKSTTITPTGNIVDRMLRDCVPSDLLNKLFNDDSFSFPYVDSNGRFEIDISGTVTKRSVTITDKSVSVSLIPTPPALLSSSATVSAASSSPQITQETNEENTNATDSTTLVSGSAPPPVPQLGMTRSNTNTPNIQWYHNAHGQRLGPISQAAMEQNIQADIVRPETLVWHAGMADWKMAKLTELASFFHSQSPPTPYRTPYNSDGNTSGQGEFAPVPAELQQGFNVGAFLLAPVWAAAHNLWVWAIGIFLVNMFLGILGLIPAAILASQANKLAWQNRRWESVEQCLEVQKIWKNWGLALLLVFVVLFFLLIGIIIIAILGASTYP